MKKIIFKIIIILSLTCPKYNAQFIDNFDKENIEGWFALVGDGNPKLSFVAGKEFATMLIDGTADKHNVYWTLIKRDVTKWLDLSKLEDPNYQLRVEAKVRLHNAPRRLNFMVNTNRTTDFHIDLMEFDIADTTNWHVISMTTKNFDAKPGDAVYVQLCATDFGLEKYKVDVDYYRADIVNINELEPDKGNSVAYHPPIPELTNFTNHLNVNHDCIINPDYPDVNFNDFHIKENEDSIYVMSINSNQWGILRWDFSNYKNQQISDAGLLELTTHSMYNGGNYIKTFGEDFGIEFGKVRVIEIFAGDDEWNQNSVTYNTLTKGKKYSEVFNSQMIYDFEVVQNKEGKNFITISAPVLNRLISGTTKGLLIRPLGAINANFYSLENKVDINTSKLHFNSVNSNH
ncbi:MAG: hypothetical protein IPH62_13420 [Ignavibacteriae bacterium]|nr:hypothetical protein [Ignavibacteriota bacterium]